MTTFDERERAYEKKFSMDQEFKFKAEARRNKLLGEWAAARLGLSGPAVSDYVKALVKADLAGTGHGAYQKLKKDFEDRSAGVRQRAARSHGQISPDRGAADRGRSRGREQIEKRAEHPALACIKRTSSRLGQTCGLVQCAIAMRRHPLKAA